jgi:hypothetical protein
MTNPIVTSSKLPRPRRRLISQYRHLKSWRKVADNFGVNHFYVHQYAVDGIEPANDEIAKRLGICRRHYRTINEHLAHDPIQDMPGPLLAYAIENREEMK